MAEQRESKENNYHCSQEEICPFPYRLILILLNGKRTLFFTFYFFEIRIFYFLVHWFVNSCTMSLKICFQVHLEFSAKSETKKSSHGLPL